MNIENLQQISAQQTRVVIFNVHTTISKLITFVVNYLQKDIDIVTAGVENIEGNDFIIIEENQEQAIQVLKPTILFVGTQNTAFNYVDLFSTITPGGIAIYPEYIAEADRAVLQTSNFFRKISYQQPEISHSEAQLSLVTEMGNIPTSFSEKFELQEILGAQHFCQHIGIMEDEFYEALIAF